MPLLGRPLDQITEATIDDLVANSVGEDRQLEYKAETVGAKPEDHKEFLKDVAAFANSSGGDLVLGMTAKDGVPLDAAGLPGVNLDKEVQRLDSMIRDSIEPRIVGYRVQPVSRTSAPPLIVVRVPKSWNAPHRVTFRGTNRFYLRNSNGVHEAGVEELRAMFLATSEMEQRAKAFRDLRNPSLRTHGPPVSLSPGILLVLHIVPLFAQRRVVDLHAAEQLQSQLRPMSQIGSTSRFNFEGFLTFSPSATGQSPAYTQLYRDGRIEAVTVLTPRRMVPNLPDYPTLNVFPWSDVAPAIFQRLPDYVFALGQLGVAPPLAVMISLLGAAGTIIQGPTPSEGALADRYDDLRTEPILIEQPRLEGPWHEQFRPALDAIWNAFGVREAPRFNAKGEWERN